MRTRSIAAGVLASSLALATTAEAAKPYVVLNDADGTFAKENATPTAFRKKVIDGYAATGLPKPEVYSVWTTFGMTGNDFVTYIDPRKNDVEGINLPLFDDAANAPLRAITYHNNVNEIPRRAMVSRAPTEGFATYLFLLEFSHLWGPQAQVPAPDPGDLIGFDYHWSFFLQGNSPAGGNDWTDNGDGTFTVIPHAPKDVAFTPLDLYLMGLGTKEEVPPFYVLTDAVVPATPTDPLWGGAFAPHSFPWFDTVNAPLTVTATKRTVTIDDVIAANGARVPAAGSKSSWTVAFVLMTGKDDTPAEIAASEESFLPIADAIPPAFKAATQDRGTLEIVSIVEEGGGGAGGGASTSASTADASSTSTSAASTSGAGGGPDGEVPAGSGCDCTTSARSSGETLAGVGLLMGLAAVMRRRRRRSAAA